MRGEQQDPDRSAQADATEATGGTAPGTAPAPEAVRRTSHAAPGQVTSAAVDPESEDQVLEPRLEEAFERTVREGEHRLRRPWRELLATGAVGGLEVGVGVLALLAVLDATGSQLLAGLAFSVGFLALLLGGSELFTESFLVPVAAVVAKHARWRALWRLWVGVLVTNLIGGWLIAWLIAVAFPELHEQAIASAEHFVEAGTTPRAFALAVLAGAVITLVTRMQHGTDDMVAKMVAAVVAGFLLAGLELFHSVLDSILIFVALHTGDAPFGYADWLDFLWLAVLGNVVGGIGLVTVLRLVRSRPRLQEERRRQDDDDEQ